MVDACAIESKSNVASSSATYAAGKYAASHFVRLMQKHFSLALDFYIVGEEEVMPTGSVHLTKENASRLLKVLDRVTPNSDELAAFIQLKNQL